MFDVGKRIGFLRKQRNLTVNKLANLAGISQSYLRDIELGNKKPTIEYLEYICEALKISLVSFFEENDGKDELPELISAMNSKQREKLIAFLKTIV